MTDATAAHQIEVRPVTQHIRIEVGGERIVDTKEALELHETRCPVRLYVPQRDVRMDLLQATDTSTHCPYKGDASYWSLTLLDATVEDIAWGYLDTIAHHEIQGLLCFYPGKVDNFLVDGEELV